VTVFANWCKGCGICVAFCPTGVLALDANDHPIVVQPDKCTACHWCDTTARIWPSSGGSENKTAARETQWSKKGRNVTVKLMQGNEAVAWGALAADCKFFAGYPITPSTEIAEMLSRELPKVGGKFIQMEDEIASLAACIGASVGGLNDDGHRGPLSLCRPSATRR
jgi:TPP-dependent indolepyruvate ferredoxin oxidoreductase alpha subunit